MKKTILFFVCMSCLITVHTQISFGLKAGFGLNFQTKPSTIIGPYTGFLPENPPEPINLVLIGYQLGLSVKHSVNSEWGLYTDLSLELIGGKYKIISANLDGTYIDHENSSRLYYLSIPILLQYQCTPLLSLDIGPKIGGLIHDIRWYKTDINVDYGLVFGMTFKVNKKTDFQVHYYHGFTATSDVVHEFIGQVQGEHDFKNRSAQFSIIHYFK